MADGGPIIYGLFAYKHSILFTKLPFSLIANLPTPTAIANPLSLLKCEESSAPRTCDDPAPSPSSTAILDLLQYYHIVNMCTSARVSKSEEHMTDIMYSQCQKPQEKSTATGKQGKRKGPSPHRIRRVIMNPKVSLASFDREFLNQLMLQNFESPFENETCKDSYYPPHTNNGRINCNMVIELVQPEKLGSSKLQLSEILETSKTLARDHSRETRRESFWKKIGLF